MGSTYNWPLLASGRCGSKHKEPWIYVNIQVTYARPGLVGLVGSRRWRAATFLHSNIKALKVQATFEIGGFRWDKHLQANDRLKTSIYEGSILALHSIECEACGRCVAAQGTLWLAEVRHRLQSTPM